VAPKLIIGLCSSTGPESGKSTVADLILQKYPQGVKMSFAGALKALADDLTNDLWNSHFGKRIVLPFIDHNDVYDTPAGGPPCGRDLLISLGNGIRKHLGESIWIDTVFKAIEQSNAPFVLIDDVRFKNEIGRIIGQENGWIFNVTDITSFRPIDSGDLSEYLKTFELTRIYNDKTSNGIQAELEKKVYPLIERAIGCR
jgi:hypothetical protein